tara:strand:- start:1056 stop:3572 length:2517 start_codon:yes stop_codon:yes gene_type:complete
MSSNQYTVNIVNADELYIGGRKIHGLEIGTLVKNDDNYGVGIGTDKPRLKLDISGNSGIRIPVGTHEQRPNNDTIKMVGGVVSGASNLLGVLRYNTTTGKYETVYDHESTSVDPSWGSFVIEKNSKVGINTQAPGQTLDVSGQIGINDYIIHNGDTNTKIGFPDNDMITMTTAGEEIMRVSSGNVGIGVTNPDYNLHIFNTNDKSFSMNKYASSSSIIYNYFENTLVNNQSPTWTNEPRYGFKLGSWRNSGDSGLILQTVHNANAAVDWKTRLKINKDGFFYFNPPNSNPERYFAPYHFSFKPTTHNKYGNVLSVANSKTNDLTFSTATTDTGNVFGDSPVFIGKGCSLYNTNASVSDTQFIAFSSEGGSGTQNFKGGGIMLGNKINFITYDTNISPPATTDSLGAAITDGYEMGLSTYSRMVIDETGKVGIGVAVPSEKLHVDGNIKATGNVTVMGTITGITTTQISSDDSKKIATTEFVKNQNYITNIANAFTYSNLYDKPSIPTHISQLTNNSGYITNIANAFTYSNLYGKPFIPTYISQLSNNSGYITSSGTAAYATAGSPNTIFWTRDGGVATYSWLSGGGGIGLYNKVGSLPPYPSGKYPVIKSTFAAIYFVVNGTNGSHTGGKYAAYIQTGNADLLNFTGQHQALPENKELITNLSSYVGRIVCASGKISSLIADSSGNFNIKSGKGGITINEALPIVKLCNSYKDKSVFGIISDMEDNNEKGLKKWEQGSFVSVIIGVDENDNRLNINALGEGAVWVNNKYGTIENGDYITTSENGYGTKQDDVFRCNYTIAKATINCEFELNSDNYECKEITYNGVTYRIAFIACIYCN